MQQTRTFFQSIKIIFQPTREFPWLSRGIILQGICQGMMTIASAHVLKIIVDAIMDGATEKLPLFIGLIIWILIIDRINMYIMNAITLNKLGPKTHANRMQRSMKKFFWLENNEVARLWTGKIINIIEKWVDAWFHVLVDMHWQWVTKATRVIGMVGYSFYLWWIYGLWMLLAVTIILINHIRLQNKANLWRRKRKKEHIEMSRQVVRQIQSKAEIVQSGKQEEESSLYNEFNVRIERYNRNIMTNKFFWDLLSHVLMNGLRILTVIAAGYGLIIGKIPLWTFVVLMGLYRTIEWNTYQMSRLYIYTTGRLIHVEKLRDLFENSKHMTDVDEGEKFYYKTWTITLHNLTFGYEWENVFDTFSLDIQWQKKTAFVGVSGSWKSTLVKLIAWYLTPQWWIISVDWQDLSTVSLRSYYKHIWYLTQEPSVFDGTIYDNLVYALNEEVDESRLEECIKADKCEFIRDFQDWVHTEIGERWIRLSGGQRQRLAIAKVFLKDPKIIILDEPTSALDSFSEEAITQAMNNLFEWRTVLIIAHRLQTVKNADEILVIEGWKVVERGDHKTLVAQWGDYATMLELQSWF